MDETQSMQRVMPHNTEAEMSVIGAMLMDQQAIGTAMDILTKDDFYSRRYGIMFETILEMEEKGIAVDPVTIQGKLLEKNLPPEMCDARAIGELIAQVPTSANVASYARIVAEKSTLRQTIRICEGIAGDAYSGTQDAQTVMTKAENEIFRLSQGRKGSDFQDIREIVTNAMHRIVRASKLDGNITGIATGFTDLDTKMAGLQNADLILIAARPSMGKTALALNIAQYVGIRQSLNVAIFSLEMSREQLVNRLFAMESHVDAQKIRTGDLNAAEWSDLIEGAELIGESHLIIDDTPAISVAMMRSKCLKFKMDQGLDLVIIDYLQLMSGSESRRIDSRQQEITEISRSLKALARELNVPVIALSQLSRAVESRSDKRPMLSDLRESGAIEQDADVVMFIYRDDYYNEDSGDRGIAEIILAKQRNGPTGTVQLKWLPELTKFANLSGAYNPERDSMNK